MTCARARKLGLLLSLPTLLAAQRHSFKQYGQDQGLGNLDVHYLMQDRTGFLWVATEGGAYRYDGRQFRGYTTAQGLPSGQVLALHQTPDGVIWAATTEGLTRLNGERFEKQPIAGYGSRSLASDAAGNLYVGSDAGLWVGKPTRGTERQFSLYTSPPGEATYINGITLDATGQVWLGCGRGICTFDGQRIAHVETAGIPKQSWGGLLFDQQGNLWARSNRKLIELPHGAHAFVARDEGLPASGRNPWVHMDRDGEIYVPTAQGLAHRTAGGWELIRRTHGLPTSDVDFFLQDREGSAWIALDGGGLVRWLGYKQWETFSESEGLSHDIVWGLARDSRGTLWAATHAGISRRPPDHRPWEPVPHPLLDMSPNMALLPDPDGTLWIGQAPGGLIHFNPAGRRAERYGASSGLNTEWIYTLARDPAGDLWVGTGDGLFIGNPSPAGLRFRHVKLPVTRPLRMAMSVAVDRRGWVWATTSLGLCYLADGRWRTVTAAEGLRHDAVTQVAAAPDGDIWVAYREAIGISRVEIAGDRVSVRHYAAANPLRAAKPYFLRFDRRGWLWMGTDIGLDRFDGTNWLHFDRGDGMALSDCDQNAFFEDADGSIWVGTSRGLSHLLNPSTALPRTQNVQPALISLKLGGVSATLGSKLSVGYDRRSLDVTFAAMTFVNEESALFRHRLVGLDDTWTETRQNEAHYPGLPPGRYRLEVQAAAAPGVWSHDTAEVSFAVQPPWWRRWWAWLACGAWLAAVIRQLWRWRVHAMLYRQQELERAVADRTQKLAFEHDNAVREKTRAESETKKVETQKLEIERLLWESRQAERLKSEFVANMSHEVRTPLNGILGMTDLMMQSELTGDQAECLRMVKVSSDSLLALMNQVLDFSRIETGKIMLDRDEFDFRDLAKATLEALEPAAHSKGLKLRTRFSPNLPLRLIGDAARTKHVLASLLGNAIKFTDDGYVELIAEAESLRGGEATIHVQIRDTGIGIPDGFQSVIFEPFRQADGSSARRHGGTGLGLAICSRLVALMNGRLWVESTTGIGSTFHFTAHFGILASRHTADKIVQPTAPDHASGLHILVVEDNAVNQKLARRLLENGGNTVTCASDGLQAIEAWSEQRFDAILMDIQMPVMDGLEAAAELRKREQLGARRTPILALTANAMHGDRERCLAAGMDGYITKPIKASELLQSIAAVVEANAAT